MRREAMGAPGSRGAFRAPSACHEVRPCRCGSVRRRVAGASSCQCFL